MFNNFPLHGYSAAVALLLLCFGIVFVIFDETEFNPIMDFYPITIIFIWAGLDNSIVAVSLGNFDQFLTPSPSQFSTSFMDGRKEKI